MNRQTTPVKSRLAVFGDSHYACIKRAVDQGLVDAGAVDLEYWGHIGKRFRNLRFVDGVITPTDELTAERFAKFSTGNRTSLPIAEFDWVFFMGCRIPGFGPFAALMQERRRGAHMTSGLKRRFLRDRLHGAPPYTFAADAAALGAARIMVAPTPFPTAAEPCYRSDLFPDIGDTTAEERDDIWAIVDDIMTEDGLILVRPPADTFVSGLYCDPVYAVEGYAETGDVAHKNAQYGALIFAQALTVVTGGAIDVPRSAVALP